MTGYLDELAYIAPMEMSEDLKAVTVNEWMNLLETLRNRKIYKKIIFDFGECVQGLWDISRLKLICGTYIHMEDLRLIR